MNWDGDSVSIYPWAMSKGLESGSSELLWREMSDEDRQREYSPSSAIGGDFSPFIEAYVQESETARVLCAEAGSDLFELRYGPADSQTIDLVVPTDGPTLPTGDLVTPTGANGAVPLLVYIHGGYWQLLSKRESFFAATGCLDQGIAFAAVDYSLAPGASLDEIVQECRDALRLLAQSAAQYGYDPNQIFIAGSSAGGHLAAMMGLTGVGNDSGFTPAGLMLISGVFELEPLIGTTVNDAVGLDLAAAVRNSPMLAKLDGLPPTLLTWGEIETDEFKRQSRMLAAKLVEAGVDTQLLEVPGRNHFDIVLGLADTRTPLGQAVRRLMVP